MVRTLFVIVIFTSLLWAGSGVPEKFGFATFDHDTGNCILSVCANGAIGFWDTNQSQGSGFWYPSWVNPTLFIASNACGNSTQYVVDSYFGPNWDDDRDWLELEDSINYHIPPEFNLQEVDCKYSDQGSTNANPQGLECYQYSVATADPTYDDFVIIEFIYKNNGSSALNGLYSAVFVDFDIPDNMRNYAKTDSALRTVYMQKSQSDDNPTVGVVYLGSEPQQQLPVANLAAVFHYDYASTGFLDSFKYLWMNGAYQQSQSTYEYDWSVAISAGPFDLPVGGEQHAAFAFVGGTSESEYLQHCQNAINFYEANWPGVAEGGDEIRRGFWLGSNLIRDRVAINYGLAREEDVRLSLFDINGRMVRDLYCGKIVGRGILNINIKGIPSGVYFVELRRRDITQSFKLLVIR